METKDQIVFENLNEKFGFTPVANVILTSTVLSPAAVRIYLIIRRYASMEKGAFPKIETICREANISKPTYHREIKKIIRSKQNPNPDVPLITAIRRRNNSNKYIIHALTDELVRKLKPAIMPEFRKSQNDTSSENQRKYQNETLESINLRLPEVSNRDSNKIEQQNRQQQQDNVVVVGSQNETDTKKGQQQEDIAVVINQFEKTLNAKITPKQAEKLLELAKKHQKDILEAIEETKTYHERSGQEIKNPYGAVHYGITTGWDLPEEWTAPADPSSPAGPAYVVIDDSYLASGFVVDNSFLDELLEFDPLGELEAEGVAK